MASLEEYRRKRQFGATPEPRGKGRAAEGNRFVVQEHHARRLHYDFRLEVDGVMKSWAVPKGPSLNPADKRLAIQTEDHPLEYRTFEGVIPAGHYGAGTVKIWDAGTFEAEGAVPVREQLQRGELKFILHGQKLRGSFVLVKFRGRDEKDKKEWLLIKHKDEAADPNWRLEENSGALPPERKKHSRGAASSSIQKTASAARKLKMPAGARRAAMPDKMRAALATLVEKPFSDPDWLFEIKWDGERTLACVRDGKARLWSRSNRDISGEYPELATLAENVAAREAWLDGEIVVLDEEGRSDFEKLQLRFGVQKPSARLLEQAPVVYYVFDLLYCDGYDLRAVPLLERKNLLKQVLREGARVRYSDHVIEKGKELYELAVERKLEGLVAKRIASAYPDGRSPAWQKIKLTRDVDTVVGGWTDPRGSREHFGALLVGVYDGGRLEFVGGVGTGFSAEVQKRLWLQLQRLKSSDCPFASQPATREKAHWVRPELVARVKFDGWTDARQLRAPRFLGLQEDRDPKTCTFDEPAKTSAARAKQGGETRDPARDSGGAGARELTSDKQIEEELERGSAEEAYAAIDGRRVHLTNLNKVYFPEDGYTKRDLLAHYFRVAPLILPFLKDRPMVLRRYPNGIHGKTFFQKDAGKDTPEWVKTVAIDSENKGKPVRYILANDRATLMYLTNLGCIDHNPWSSRYDDQEHPDYVFFDLDPTEGTPFSTVAKLAKLLLAALEKFELKGFAKTSGASGVHIFLPVKPRYTYAQARMLVQAIASIVDRDHPGLITLERSVGKRRAGTVYVDAHQNSRGQSLASVYSVRAFPHAPVSTPIKPSELTGNARPETWNLKTIARRIEKAGDLWAAFWKQSQDLDVLLKQSGSSGGAGRA